MRSTCMLLLLACNLDSALHGKGAEDAGLDTSGTFDVPTQTDDSATLPPDTAGEDACTLESTAAGTVAVGDACTGAWVPATDPSDVVQEWAITGFVVVTMPVVAELTDDDGDGDVDTSDTPDIVVVVDNQDLRAYSGDGSGLLWSVNGYIGVTPAVADIDGDGVSDLLAATPTALCALGPDGVERWCNTDYVADNLSSIVVMDVDADGHPEVLAPNVLADAETGASLATGLCPVFLPELASWSDAYAQDIDGDGVAEIFCGVGAWRADGTQMWDGEAAEANGLALIDRGLDGAPEAAVQQIEGDLLLYDAATGVLIDRLANNGSGSPCVADLDGDGVSEIVTPTGGALQAYDLDFRLLWSLPVDELRGYASCSAFDFDADGAYEILYADQSSFSIVDGSTGDLRYEWTDHVSTTYNEYPVVADVDGDGSSEVVVAESDIYGPQNGLVVFGHGVNGWPPTDPLWADHGFDATLVDADGTIYADRPAPPSLGGFAHARPPGRYTPTGWDLEVASPQLSVRIDDLCAQACEAGLLDVAVSVANGGPGDAEAEVELYTYDSVGERSLAVTPVTLLSGIRAEPLVYTVALADLGDGLGARVRIVSGPADCGPSDDDARTTDLPCR